mgnify:FL=1
MRLFQRFYPKKAEAVVPPTRLNPTGPEGQPRNDAQMAALEQAIDNISDRVQGAREKTHEAYLANMAVFDAFEGLVKERKKKLGMNEHDDGNTTRHRKKSKRT